MSKVKQYQLWVCFAVGLALFVGTYPFYHDRYIAQIHMFICIGLNAFSSILFGAFLYCKWMNRISTKRNILFLILTVIQAVGHSIFYIMNWGSFLFLPLSVIVFIFLVVSNFRKKSE